MSWTQLCAVMAASGLMGTSALAQPTAVPMEAGRLSDHIRILSSDDFEGRAPATAGEIKSVDYITAQFKALGLMPGGKAGSWTQPVKLNRFSITRPVVASLSLNGWSRALVDGDDVVLGSRRPAAGVHVTSAPLVFVGYGVHAPERGWDDFKGMDMHGKIMVVLVNDPDFETAKPGAFDGKAMTYYGRWTYKFEEAARQGAAGVLVVHETPGAGYGWATVKSSWSADQFDILHDDPASATAPLEG